MQPSDQRLLHMGESVAMEIPWDQLLHTCPLSGGGWKPKRMDGDFALYTQSSKYTATSFMVLSKCTIPCNVQELRSIFHTLSSEALSSVLDTLGRHEFVGGQLVHQVDVVDTDSWSASQSTVSSTASIGSERTMKHQPLDNDGMLSVQSLLFDRTHIFGSMEQWYLLDLLRTYDSTDGRGSFTKTIMSLDQEDFWPSTINAVPISHVKFGHGLLASFLCEAHAVDQTHVTFYGEYLGGKRFSKHAKATQLSSRAVKARLISFAEMIKRFILIVRRRRLGMQVLADRTMLLASNEHCICCQRSFMLLRKRMCLLCGYLVCNKCSHLQEREFRDRNSRSRPRIDRVRICQRCLVRVGQCKYTNVTEEDLMPVEVVPDPKPRGKSGALLCQMLQQTLAQERNAARRASTRSVIQYLIESDAEEHKKVVGRRQRSKTGSSTTSITTDYSDQQQVSALQQALQDEDLPLEACELANNKKRNYAISYPDDPNAPINTTIGPNDFKRREIIQRNKLDELGPVPELDIICSIAANELKCLGSVVTVVHDETYYIAASTLPPFAYQSLPRNEGFCTQLSMNDKPLVVNNIQSDVRFTKIGAVQQLDLKFYVGFPLVAEDQTMIGSVCCIDQQPRKLTRSEYAVMKKLAETASKVVQRQTRKQAKQSR